MIGVAAFDVDGTLTVRDCVVPFLRQVAGTTALAGRMLRHPVRLASAGWHRDRDSLKVASAAAAFSGRPLGEVKETADTFARSVYADGLRSDVVDCLNAHLHAGDVVVLVSASFEIYLEPLADLLAVEKVLATRLVVSPESMLTGQLDGPNCRGPEKVRRLHGWLDEELGGRGNVHLTAYGDSPGDRELLADADVAHWVDQGKING